MTRTVEGLLDARGLRLAIVVSRFHELVAERLLAGAMRFLDTHGQDPALREVVWVPGAWELPLAASWVAHARRHEAIVALGCLLRGETPHFDIIAAEAAKGLAAVATSSGIPVGFGVLTAHTLDQALERSGGKAGNKGWDAALAAVQMVGLRRDLQ